MNQIDRLTLLVAAMLTGISSPGDALVDQTIMLARVMLAKIEAEKC